MHTIHTQAINTQLVRRIRSYCRREGRNTSAREETLISLWPRYGISVEQKNILELDTIFKRHAPRVLEIGFGDGKSLLQMALSHPERDFIGIEVYRTGVASLLMAIEELGISNLRLICSDAVDVLANNLSNSSLASVQIFFPDPWPKKRHHKRRLIQPSFLSLAHQKLEVGGILHLATDWKEYAEHMMSVISSTSGFENLAGKHQYSLKPDYRPLTKYEERGKRLGHLSWDLIFRRI